MAYPANKSPDPDSIALMFDEKKLNNIAELFKSGDPAMGMPTGGLIKPAIRGQYMSPGQLDDPLE